jgi:hypothetical protein
MDSSTHLERKKQAMTQYLHRQSCVDAGLHTKIQNIMANTYYVSPNDTWKSNENTIPIKPAPGCVSKGLCADIRSSPYISTPCIPILYVSTMYVPTCKVALYQATPNEQSAAVARAVNRAICPS